jgi:hypothetical protein
MPEAWVIEAMSYCTGRREMKKLLNVQWAVFGCEVTGGSDEVLLSRSF